MNPLKRTENYHNRYPFVWEFYQQFTLDIYQKTGRVRYGPNMIIGKVRWHLAYDYDMNDFKISTDVTPYYARAFNLAHFHMFDTRTCWSVPLSEAEIEQRLREIFNIPRETQCTY